ncbi:MAG: cob(I)yrinic acid a,c-diamide adenosyltransferase [Acidobacteriota bacterium]
MPRITKVYTRTGDDGTTALGTGTRVPKESLRIAAYGTADELNSVLGVAVASGVPDALLEPLAKIQNDLFHLGSDLCIPEDDPNAPEVPRIEDRHVDQLEAWMDAWQEELEPLQNFILPGGSLAAAHLHVARTVCRRAEREATELSRTEFVGKPVIRYLNRLSDALFVMARYANLKRGVGDVLWDSRA